MWNLRSPKKMRKETIAIHPELSADSGQQTPRNVN